MNIHKLSDIARLYVAEHKLPMTTCYKERMIIRTPIDWLLCGMTLEPSGFEKGIFYAIAFVMPTPTTERDSQVSLEFGSRLGELCKGSDVWWRWHGEAAESDLDEFEHCVKSHLPRFWKKLGTPNGFLSSYRQVVKGVPTLSQLCNLAKVSVIGGSRLRALYYSLRLHWRYTRTKPRHDFDVERVEQIQTVMRAFRHSHQAALELLNGWRMRFLEDMDLHQYAGDVFGDDAAGDESDDRRARS